MITDKICMKFVGPSWISWMENDALIRQAIPKHTGTNTAVILFPLPEIAQINAYKLIIQSSNKIVQYREDRYVFSDQIFRHCHCSNCTLIWYR